VQGVDDVLHRVELLGGEGVDEQLADGPQMRSGCAAERVEANIGEDDLGAAAVRLAFLPLDRLASFHPGQVMGQPAGRCNRWGTVHRRPAAGRI